MDSGSSFEGKDGEDRKPKSSPFAIPMVQQVMSATRGVTDAFSGLGRPANSLPRKPGQGMKNIGASVGSGFGFDPFGVGAAFKHKVIHPIQSSLLQARTKLMFKILAPSLPSAQNFVPGSMQSSINALTSTSSENVQSSIGNVVHLAAKLGSFYHPETHDNVHKHSHEQKGTLESGSRTEKVLDSFLLNSVLKKEDAKVNELAETLRSENNVLQVLLKHQQSIQELVEENQKLQRILVEDLKVPPSKLIKGHESSMNSNCQCSDCFQCRRKMRKSGR